MKPLTKYVLLFFCGLLLCGISYAQSKEIQLETKIITAFLQKQEVDSNALSDAFDTIFICYNFKPDNHRIYYYSNKQVINPNKVDTGYLDDWFDKNGHIVFFQFKRNDTISLVFQYKNFMRQWGLINFKKESNGNLSILNIEYRNKSKDTLYKYYADFRKDSIANLGLRNKYYDSFYEGDFTGLSKKGIVKLLGRPNSIDTVSTKSSPNRVVYIYNLDLDGTSSNWSRRSLLVTIENNIVVMDSEWHGFSIEVSAGGSVW